MSHYHVFLARPTKNMVNVLTPNGEEIWDEYWDASVFPPKLRRRKRKEQDGWTYSPSNMVTRSDWRREEGDTARKWAKTQRPSKDLYEVKRCKGEWCPAPEPVENQRWASADAPTGGRPKAAA